MAMMLGNEISRESTVPFFTHEKMEKAGRSMSVPRTYARLTFWTDE